MIPMSDEEQLRLLTEIRDILKAQSAWSRETVKKRGRVGIIMMAIILVFLVGYAYVIIHGRNYDQHEGQKQAQPQPADATPK
jgi:flagellar basal body-associated protein FliL